MQAIVRGYPSYPNETTIMQVSKIVPAGIIVDDSAADEIDVKLIPWHRVWEIRTDIEGELI